MTKYINIANIKTGKVIMEEWPNYSFKNNPYTRLKTGYKIIGVYNTFGQALVKGLIQNR